ncbi:nitroreductase family protein [Edaphobacillus lindanitolerans]|uniref:Uncharacterized protein n=1 Tax=Edaphobacillus lindanitolerans TaxID=550447 RepID=A0A1U7PL21_9BACI|nr:hypothetical protein [Edaphobacillus lindanitolerans]SIT87210.1 hypothetical protein SAMN05428946_2015 [Edaphobacillus lindanitolerans]
MKIGSGMSRIRSRESGGMDAAYLEAFTDSRHLHFAHGRPPGKPDPFGQLISPASFDPADREAERLLLPVYRLTERIVRVDLASKYAFHPAAPGARNLKTARIISQRGNRLYAFNPLADRLIDIGRAASADSGDLLFALLTDDRRLQWYYGEFHRMLSALNAGHVLFNLEFALRHSGRPYGFAGGRSPIPEMLRTDPAVRLRAVIRAGAEPHPAGLPDPDPLFEGLVPEYFYRRSADQRIDGDVFFHRTLGRQPFIRLLDRTAAAAEEAGIRLYAAVNDVEDTAPGYYRVHCGGLEWTGAFGNGPEDLRLLRDYREYSNFHGFNFWLFMIFDKEISEEDAEERFIDMGRLMQFVSVSMAAQGRGVRGLKNYDDAYFRRKTGLPGEMAIGYSGIVFPNRNQAASIRVPSAERTEGG